MAPENWRKWRKLVFLVGPFQVFPGASGYLKLEWEGCSVVFDVRQTDRRVARLNVPSCLWFLIIAK